MTKLRVLCLHGYHGNGEVLRGQMRGWASELDDLAELIYVDAPSLAGGDFGWWHAKADTTAPGDAHARRYRGWSRTRAWIARQVAEHGPFDGVFGFSQGAALAALLVALSVVGPQATRLPFRFGIMVGGFPSNDARHAPWFADAARAVRLVRAHGRDWGVDTTRVGVLGFSAGGHLASLLSTQPARPAPAADDLATISARPDLVALAYPLISFVDGYSPGAFAGSAENFFGEDDVDEARRRELSNELHVAPGHPPVFLWTTADDSIVPASHSERFADACRRAHVPISFTTFARGSHGLGLALGQPGPLGQWTTQLLGWLGERWPGR